MKPEILTLNISDAWEVAWGDHQDYEDVTDREIDCQGRWTTSFSKVVKRKSDGKLFLIDWTQGSTEQQEGSESVGGLWSGSKDLTSWLEVEAYDKTVIEYREKKETSDV